VRSSFLFFFFIFFIIHHLNKFLYLLDGTESVPPPNLEVYYNCQSKKGRLVIKWDCAVIDSQLANMPFHMLSTNEQQYQWQIQHNNLQQIIGAIGTRNMKLAALGKALSLISSF
jgi:hypothetical protein